jgi:hypothetical protein
MALGGSGRGRRGGGRGGGAHVSVLPLLFVHFCFGPRNRASSDAISDGSAVRIAQLVPRGHIKPVGP